MALMQRRPVTSWGNRTIIAGSFGPNGAALLRKFGVATAYDFARRPEAWVAGLLHKPGRETWFELQGHPMHAVDPTPKSTYGSIMKSHTFSPPTADRELVYAELLRNADTAMYQSKATSRGRFALFEPAMHARQLARLELEGHLRGALAAGEFRLVYQPIVELPTGRVVAAEALLRWDRPGPPIGPDKFIPLVEDTGDIVPIGRWVLAEACRQARRWQQETSLAGFAISVNASARELAEPQFVAQVVDTLAATDLAPEYLTLEVTESVLLADESEAVGTLRALRDAGVHIAVDDFGTGYSSLSYLDRLPVDALKIDRSFVQGLAPGRGKSALVSATLGFARALGLTVTAEGVETDQQVRKLQELRCRLGQGFYFSQPLAAESLVEFLASGRSYPTHQARGRPGPDPLRGQTGDTRDLIRRAPAR